MMREKFFRRLALCFLVKLERSGHRTTSPAVYWQKLVRTASVDDAPWSQPSLRSRLGMGISQARPLLSRLVPAPPIPARPFGLGLRFDEALLVAPYCPAPEVSSQPTKRAACSTRFRTMQAQRTLSRRAETTGSAGTESGRVGNADAPKG
jgi:hypothetical protein